MCQGPLCPNLSQKVQKEVFQMANCKLSCAMPQGGLSVILNHLKIRTTMVEIITKDSNRATMVEIITKEISRATMVENITIDSTRTTMEEI